MRPPLRLIEFVLVDHNPGRGRAAREFIMCASPERAKAAAGAKARRIDGPVDIAYGGAEPWEDRYITTAAPSEFHAKGYRLERLD